MSDKDIVMTWRGVEYRVVEEKTMALGAIVEDIVNITQLSNPAGPPLFKASMALGAALRFAGCKVSDREIHSALFEKDAAASMLATLNVLLSIMLPPDLVIKHLDKNKPVDAPQKKTKARKG